MDVDNFLAELLPEQVDEWQAAFDCGVVADAWELAAATAAAAHNAGVLAVNAQLAEGARPLEYSAPQEFMPYEKHRRPPRRLMSVEEDEARARAGN